MPFNFYEKGQIMNTKTLLIFIGDSIQKRSEPTVKGEYVTLLGET